VVAKFKPVITKLDHKHQLASVIILSFVFLDNTRHVLVSTLNVNAATRYIYGGNLSAVNRSNVEGAAS
jgi:hypothetical protein